MNKNSLHFIPLLFIFLLAIGNLQAQTPVVFDQPLPENTTVECDAIPPAAVVTATGCNAPTPFAFINEIHYDNTGGDVGEFIEIAGLAGTDLSGYQLLAYDADDLLDAQLTLSGVIPDEGGGFGAIAFFLADLNSQFFENGPEEGRALMQTGVGIVHFISYEGVVNAADGPAVGLTSENIGTEPGTTPVGQSLQLSGGPGCPFADFTWGGPSTDSPGLLNAGQTFSADLCPGDNNAIVTLAEIIVPGSCAGEYSLLREYTAIDGCGTVATFTQTINVEDNTAPAFCNAPANITLACTDAIPTAPLVTAVDNCNSGSAPVWINEFHYDNSGGDVGEFIEVAGSAGFDLSACQLVLYNGAGGAVYNTISLTGMIPNESGGHGAIAFPLPVNGLQNGSPDGIALVCNGVVLEFISYEGTFTASNGPASGTLSTDVGVAEGGGTAIGESLQLTGCGDLVWAGPSAESPGALNDGQIIGDAVATTLVETTPTGSCSSFTRTWTAIDDCGNEATHVQTISITDTEPPVVTCPPNAFGLTCNQNPPAAATTAAEFVAMGGTIADNCADLDDLTVVSMISNNGGTSCPGSGLVITRLYTIIDACGNAGTCEQTFTYLESTSSPVITSVAPTCYKYCADLANPMESDITYDVDCNFGATVNITGPTQIGPDNCPNTIYRYTYTVTDDCGRISAPVTRDFVIGNDGPTIECMPYNLILECGDPDNDMYIATHLSQVTANSSCELGVNITNNFTGLNFTSCNNSTKVVTFTATDNCGRTATCTTTITIQDNENPFITNVPPSICDATECGGDVDYWFDHWVDYMLEGLTATDQCDNFVTWSTIPANPQLNTDCDPVTGDAVTTVTFVASDNCGNTAAHVGTFTVENEFPAAFENVPADATVSCGDPIVFGPAPTVINECNTTVTSADAVDNTDPCNVLHTRTWTATDACGGLTTAVTQTITEVDDAAPVITGGADATVECDGAGNVAELQAWVDSNAGASAADACGNGENWTNDFDISNVVLTPDCAGGVIAYIDVTFTATDNCNNASSITHRFNVEDTTAPTFDTTPMDGTVDCDETPTYDNVTATDVCTVAIVTFNDTQTGDSCEGAYTRTWTATDACGNTATISQTFTYSDTEAPVFTSVPTGGDVECADDAVFGDAEATDNCNTVTITFDDVTTGDACSGSVTRTWTATDACGNSSTASATISYEDTEAPVASNVPADMTIDCSEPVVFGDDPTWTDNCDTDIFTSTEDVETPGNCAGNYTIERFWSAIDDCGNLEVVSQTITVEDTTAPVFTFVPADSEQECGNDPDFGDAEATDDCSNVTITFEDEMTGGCAGSVTRTWTATDDCGNSSTASATITFNDDEPPVFTYVPGVVDLDCDDDLTPEAPQATDNCGTVTVEITGEDINGDLCDDGYAHNYTWTATDACGNTATVVTTVWVDPDNEAPVFTFVPEGDLITCDEFPPTFGDVEVEDACGSVTLTFIDEAVGNPNGCDDGENFDYRRVWTATDECGNSSTAKQTFWVKVEGPAAVVSGLVTTEMDEPVEDVSVTIEGGIAGYSETQITAEDGLYNFAELPLESNYTITPYSNENPMNGVTTYDLVLISKHILEIQELDSPYKMIAADINKSGSISTLDLIELRKMILFINQEFPDNDSWRFVEANFVFPFPTNPFATGFPEMTNINNLLEDEQHDYIAVKIGDVNGTVVANNLLGGEDRTFNGNLNFEVNDLQMKAGNTYKVAVRSSDFNAIAGYQYSLAFDESQMEIVDVEAGSLNGLSAANFGWSKVDEGVVTTSWNTATAQTLTADEVLFTLTVKATATTTLSEVLNIGSRYTQAEAYNTQLDLLEVNLRFNGADVAASFKLEQNHPNPFKQNTVIGFSLPEAANATLSFYDVSGKVLKQVTGDFAKGYNEVSLNRSDLQANGLVYYELVTPTHTATRRMLLTNN